MSKKALGIVLPDEWSVARLADISDVRDGTHDSPKYLESGIPFITSKNLKNGKLDFTTCNFISEEDHRKFSERSNVQNGDIIFGMIGTLGSPVIVDTDFEFSIKNVALIKFNNTQLFNQYMKYLLDSTLVQREFERISDGGVQKFISLSTIRSLQIPIPPLKEQQKIAEILSSVDAAIEKTEQVIAKTEEVKKGLMQQLLTKGIGHTEFKQTEIGEIPVEWQVKKLVNFSKINSENLTSSTQPEYEFNYIDIAAITDTGIIGETTKYSFCDAPSRARRVVRNKDIIVSTVRPYLKSFAFITEEQDGYIASTGFAIIRVNEDIDSNYIYQHILSERFIEYCKSKMTGSNYPAISANDVKEYSIGIPPLKEQKKISSILSECDKKLQCEKDNIIKLKSIKQGLMQQLLTGKVRVTTD